MNTRQMLLVAMAAAAAALLAGCASLKPGGSGTMDQSTINAHIAAKRANGGNPAAPK